jgi:GrpB-like predicted nucleotidyltransferase (UPF0157 family)
VTASAEEPTGSQTRAAAARAELLGRLPGLFAAIEHIGSTSVPGLAAKRLYPIG